MLPTHASNCPNDITGNTSRAHEHCNGLSTPRTYSSAKQEVDDFPSSIIPSIGQNLSSAVTTTQKKTMYVRALFEYDPLNDNGLPSRGLSFHHGDILHVVNASDREWWQARRITFMTTPETNHDDLTNCNDRTVELSTSKSNLLTVSQGLGIIPSRERIERRHRLRLKHVNFSGKVTVIGNADATPVSSNFPFETNPVPNSVIGFNSRTYNPYDYTASTASFADDNRLKTTMIDRRFSQTSINNRSNHCGRSDYKNRRSMSLTRNLFKCFTYRITKPDNTNNVIIPRSGSLGTASECPSLNSARSYEIVVPVTIDMARPLIFCGPLKEHIIAQLLQDPNFTTCVPHTSRPQSVHEVDGVDFHFIPNKTAMEKDIEDGLYVEVNRFQNHYYATSLESVRKVLKSGRVCIIEISLNNLKALDDAGLYPISILLKPKSIPVLKSLQHRLTDDQARRALEMVTQLESENWHILSAIIEYDDLNVALKYVQQYLNLHKGPIIWITASDSISTTAGSGISSPGSGNAYL